MTSLNNSNENLTKKRFSTENEKAQVVTQPVEHEFEGFSFQKFIVLKKKIRKQSTSTNWDDMTN